MEEWQDETYYFVERTTYKVQFATNHVKDTTNVAQKLIACMKNGKHLPSVKHDDDRIMLCFKSREMTDQYRKTNQKISSCKFSE